MGTDLGAITQHISAYTTGLWLCTFTDEALMIAVHRIKERKNEENVLFNNTLNVIVYMVSDIR